MTNADSSDKAVKSSPKRKLLLSLSPKVTSTVSPSAVMEASSPSCPALKTPSGGSKTWLLRLFESKMFDTAMAMAYLFNSKEPGVLGYIGNKLFSYEQTELDFYLPQMVNMYIMHHEVGKCFTLEIKI